MCPSAVRRVAGRSIFAGVGTGCLAGVRCSTRTALDVGVFEPRTSLSAGDRKTTGGQTKISCGARPGIDDRPTGEPKLTRYYRTLCRDGADTRFGARGATGRTWLGKCATDRLF